MIRSICAVMNFAMVLNPAVGRGGVCGFWGAGQGATTRNGHSIQGVATLPCAAKTVQSVLWRAHPKGEGQIGTKHFYLS